MSSVKHQVIDRNNKILNKGEFGIDLIKDGLIHVINQISIVAENLNDDNTIDMVVISMPGVVNANTLKVERSIFSDYDSLHLNISEQWNKLSKIRLTIVNDANSFILGELFHGKLKGVKNAFYLMLGSSIGSAMVINGELYEGANGWAGSIGDNYISDRKWEEQFSTRYLRMAITLYMGMEKTLSFEECMKVKETNSDVKEIYDNWIRGISKGILNIIYLLNPEKILIGGSSIQLDALSLYDIVNELSLISSEEVIKNTKIDIATKGFEISALGCSEYCKESKY